MKNIDKTPKITQFIENCLHKQDVYKLKNKYKLVYVNDCLYEKIFNEKFNFKIAKNKLEKMFNISLKNNGNFCDKIGTAFSDKHLDPMGISLSGNLGSGRAFFYLDNFNIKGEKTELATSKNDNYSNGMFALSASLKETIVSNILSEELPYKTFKTLAILDKQEDFTFNDEYLDYDDSIKINKYNLPSVIEIRYYEDTEFYRLSNHLFQNGQMSVEEILDYSKRLANIEAFKFSSRLLHGSWSVGNISVKANLIDFDTACFVKGRFPQYSNTNKYKSNYFGYELIGQKKIIECLFNHYNYNKDVLSKVLQGMDSEYLEKSRFYFCELLGLSYKNHYAQNKQKIDLLFDMFNSLSRKFLPNYYETNVNEIYTNSTFIFDFSTFFANFLIKYKNGSSVFELLNLLLNKTQNVDYKQVGMVKGKVEEFFAEDLVKADNLDNYILQAMNFVEIYKSLFEDIEKTEDLNKIKIKQLVLNFDRSYLTGNNFIYSMLNNLYMDKKISPNTLTKITNALIKTNIRICQNENMLGLKLYKRFLTYFVINDCGIKFKLEPYLLNNVSFAKVIFGENVYHLHYNSDGSWESDLLDFNNLALILDKNINVWVNGKIYNSMLFDE